MRFHRRTAPKVVDGRVQRQNNWRRSGHDYVATHQIRIERYAPKPGYRHLVSPADVSAFLALLPDWRELSIGLRRVVLDDDTTCDGWCSTFTVAICAWEAGYSRIVSREYHDDHAGIFRRMGVPCRPVVLPGDALCPGCYESLDLDAWSVCRFCRGSLAGAYRDATRSAEDVCYLAEFTESTAQAFLLVHVLVHELGHHHDRMTSPRQRDFTRGERYAEDYAKRYEDAIWPAYCRVFRPGGEPRRR
jgi:hypothetical protein